MISFNNSLWEPARYRGPHGIALYEWLGENELSTRRATEGEDLKGLVNYGGSVERFSDEFAELMLLQNRAHHSPLLRESFLLLRLLCRYKENEVAVGQPRRFLFCL